MKASRFFVGVLIATLPRSPTSAEEVGGIWVSQPRSALTIVVGEDGGRITGPGWEHRFDADARTLDFEIAPERRMVLRRSRNTWIGEYFHPGIGPLAHERDEHRMTFVCSAGACAGQR
jgi:hypothetical protein